MGSAQFTLHTGTPLPARLITNVGSWAQDELTPGWFAALPATVAELCERWRIALDPVIPETEITLVLLGRSAELGPVVIKSSPLAEEFRAEATALRVAASANVARLYDLDLARSAMVIERIVPGTQLREAAMPDEDASHLAAETVATMWRPLADPAGLFPLSRWMRALFEWTPHPERIPAELIAHAQELGGWLLDRSTRTCLLHGDFQHHNLLRRTSGDWAIIDPKGLAGDPGFEIAAWMYNPPGVTLREDYPELASRRLEIFAETWSIDRHELTAWAFVGMVLSACWSASEPSPPGLLREAIRGAEQLRRLLS